MARIDAGTGFRHRRAVAVSSAVMVSALLVTACSGSSASPAPTQASASRSISLTTADSGKSTPPSHATSSSKPTKAPFSPSATDRLGDEPLTGAPGAPYIAVCNTPEIDYYSPVSGVLYATQPTTGLGDIYQVPGATDPDGSRGVFSATGSTAPGSGELFSCSGLSYNGSLNRVAGLDSYKAGDTVPAYMDLNTGKVVDVIKPKSHSGFARTTPTTYTYAVYNPLNDDLWALRAQGSTQVVYQDVATGGTPYFYNLGDAELDDVALGFINHADVPVAYYTDQAFIYVLGKPNANVTNDDFEYLSDRNLPATDYRVQSIRRPDTGTGGAFIAYPATSQTPQLFVFSGKGSTPKKLTTIVAPPGAPTNGNPQVIRFFPPGS